MAADRQVWSHQAAFEATPASASRARSFVVRHLVEHRLPYLVDAVRLVASELSTNALVHANTAFLVTLAARDGAVRLTVRDDSRSLPAQRTAQVMDSTGRGLEIVAIVSSDWGIDTDTVGSKAVWASFPLRGPGTF